MADLKLFFNEKIARYLKSLLKLYNSEKINWKSKSLISFDPVTKFDLKIEKELKKLILKKFPKSNFIGEETKSKISNKKKPNNFTWVVDPIDGTKNFILGAPTWSNLIGLNINGSPTYGLAFFPIEERSRFKTKSERRKVIINLKKILSSLSIKSKICIETDISVKKLDILLKTKGLNKLGILIDIGNIRANNFNLFMSQLNFISDILWRGLSIIKSIYIDDSFILLYLSFFFYFFKKFVIK